MSVGNVQKFYEAIAGDEGFRLQLIELSRHHRKGEMDEARIAQLLEKEILPLAARMGLGFSLADLWRHAEELQQGDLGEDLDDDELGAVVGGRDLCVLTGGTAGHCACYFIGAGSVHGLGKAEPGFTSCFLAGHLPP